MFNFFKRKTKEEEIEDKPFLINSIIPDKVATVKIPKYDKIEALSTFLKINGFNDNDIKTILDNRFPFDIAWKQYFLPRDKYYGEMLRRINILKLLVIEGLTNNTQRGSFIVSCVEYFRLYVGRMIGISYPDCKKGLDYDLYGFCEKLDNNDFEWVKKGLDKDVFNCIAFYSQRYNITFEGIMDEFIEQISKTQQVYQYDSIGGVNLFVDMISKLLELSYNNMNFSLKSVIPIEKQEETIKTKEEKDFFDFTNMQSIYEGIQKQYIIQDENMAIAEREISKALRVIDFLKEEKKIPNNISFDIRNIVYAMQYPEMNNNINFYTFLRYTPLTSTGRVAKNMCVLNFDVNEKPSKFLNAGLFTVNDFRDADEHKGLGGVIKYNKDKEITEIHMFFYKNDNSYTIKTKTDKIEKIDDVQLTINGVLQ